MQMYHFYYFNEVCFAANFAFDKTKDMSTTKIFVINGGQVFEHSGGKFNETLFNATQEFFNETTGYEIRATNINDEFDAKQEVENFVWADVIIYHTPIWWFQLPNRFKKYIDEVFTEGHQKGIYH